MQLLAAYYTKTSLVSTFENATTASKPAKMVGNGVIFIQKCAEIFFSKKLKQFCSKIFAKNKESEKNFPAVHYSKRSRAVENEAF